MAFQYYYGERIRINVSCVTKKIDTLCQFKPKPDFKIFNCQDETVPIFLEPRRRLTRGVRENQ